jgi:hypothetical protein
MEKLHSRTIEYFDGDNLDARKGHEVLFRTPGGFVLYLSSDDQQPASKERIVRLDAREALLWLNETESGRLWG